jgi:molecular chaperone HtpG
MTHETFTFQTEVGRLLDIVAHSLYTHKEIFLRELISNASDACDRLRYAALTDPGLTVGDPDLAIRVLVDREQRTLSIEDNGIGMNRDDLLETLGTIARSGSQAFLSQLTGDARKDVTLVGQFGVGFYSAFMVAERVDVLTRRAGEEAAWLWSSDGQGSFTIDSAERPTRGTTVIVHLSPTADEFLEETRIRGVVKTYSDHIAFPIRFGLGDSAPMLNAASSLWTRSKREIEQAQYTEFYRHVAHSFDEPWMTVHATVEGVVSFTCLLFVPGSPPFDLFEPERKSRVKLYVKRVFITDDAEGLIPSYLRFLRGIIDSEDLPLNISRETVQRDPRLARIRSAVVKRVLDELAKKATADAAAYDTFWTSFGAVLKEGLYEDPDNRDRLLGLARFRSTAGDGLTSLDAYIERMKDGQEAIYTISGERVDILAKSPQLEGFRAKGVEVLLLTDPIDEFWMPSVGKYKDKAFTSAAAADVDLSGIQSSDDDSKAPQPETPAAGLERLLAALRTTLKGSVKDVRASERLTDSPVCLVADSGDMDMYLERMLRQHRQIEGSQPTPRILEINPYHPLITRMAACAETAGNADAELGDAAFLLLDQARIIEGEAVADPQAFARRLSAIIGKGLTLSAIPEPPTSEQPPTEPQSSEAPSSDQPLPEQPFQSSPG